MEEEGLCRACRVRFSKAQNPWSALPGFFHISSGNRRVLPRGASCATGISLAAWHRCHVRCCGRRLALTESPCPPTAKLARLEFGLPAGLGLSAPTERASVKKAVYDDSAASAALSVPVSLNECNDWKRLGLNSASGADCGRLGAVTSEWLEQADRVGGGPDVCRGPAWRGGVAETRAGPAWY